MKSYFGLYKNNNIVEPIEATVLVFDTSLSIGFRTITGINEMEGWLIKDITYQYNPSAGETVIRNTKHTGAVLVIAGNEAATFLKIVKEEIEKPWHKKNKGKQWVRNGLLALGIVSILFLLYLLIVPWLSEKLATSVSEKTEQQLGDAVYTGMNMSGKEDTAASQILNNFFQAMKVPTAYNIRITVVNDNVVNAFALPGGRIVIYSALLKQVESYPELAALLSHEFTHVNNKHSTKSIFRKLGSKIFVGLLFGRFGNVASVLVNHADDLKSLKYSRSLEKEADIEGLQILMQRKIDTKGFEKLFWHLKKASPESSLPTFLASHPDLDDRIEYINKEGKNAEVADNSILKSIFEQLK